MQGCAAMHHPMPDGIEPGPCARKPRQQTGYTIGVKGLPRGLPGWPGVEHALFNLEPCPSIM